MRNYANVLIKHIVLIKHCIRKLKNMVIVLTHIFIFNICNNNQMKLIKFRFS